MEYIDKIVLRDRLLELRRAVKKQVWRNPDNSKALINLVWDATYAIQHIDKDLQLSWYRNCAPALVRKLEKGLIRLSA